MIPFSDLFLYAASVYGLAWLWTQSTLLAPARHALQRAAPPTLAEGLGCLVCSGTWIAIALFLLRHRVGVFSPVFASSPVWSLPVWIGLSVAVNWTLGRHNGELRDEDD